MTDLASALASTYLGSFEGKDVISSGIEVHGLARSMREVTAIEPATWRQGDKVILVIETTVGPIRHDPIKDTDCDRRVHVLDADMVTWVDEKFAKSELDSQRRRILDAKLAAGTLQGIQEPIPGTDSSDADISDEEWMDNSV